MKPHRPRPKHLHAAHGLAIVLAAVLALSATAGEAGGLTEADRLNGSGAATTRHPAPAQRAPTLFPLTLAPLPLN